MFLEQGDYIFISDAKHSFQRVFTSSLKLLNAESAELKLTLN